MVRSDTKSSLRPRRPATKASLTHRVSFDHHVALTTKAPGNQRLSATKSRRQGRRHRLSWSPRLDLPLLRSFFTKKGSPVPAQEPCRSTPSRRVLRRASLACRSKTSIHKVALTRTSLNKHYSLTKSALMPLIWSSSNMVARR